MDFTEDDLRLIMAMCRTSNPQFPERPMYPAWIPVFEKAEKMLEALENPDHDEYECLHYDDGCRCRCADCVRMK